MLIIAGCWPADAPRDEPVLAPTVRVGTGVPDAGSDAGVLDAGAPAASASVAVAEPCPDLKSPSDKDAGALPEYVEGFATLRVGVFHSRKAAKAKLVALKEKVKDQDWGDHLRVYGTRSRHDPKVRARIDVTDVSPESAVALCAWLDQHGWNSGAVPCEVRK